jgi:hypothetical protein
MDESEENVTSLYSLTTIHISTVPAHHQPHRRLLFFKYQYLHHFVDEFAVDFAMFDLYL